MRCPDYCRLAWGFRLATFQTAPTEHGILASLSAMALGILLVSFVLVRSVTAPLRTLARAADRFGVVAKIDVFPHFSHRFLSSELSPRSFPKLTGTGTDR